MTYNLIRYGVKDASTAENRALVAKVFEALDETQPQSVRYLVLELDNGEFVHLVGYDKDSSALTELDAFKAFGASHAERRSTRAPPSCAASAFTIASCTMSSPSIAEPAMRAA